MPRVPEPEVMDDCGEVEAYSSSAAQSYLSSIDDAFVERALSLVRDSARLHSDGRALDIGAGPGQIVLKLARRLPAWQFIGIDRSPNMAREAMAARAANGGATAAVTTAAATNAAANDVTLVQAASGRPRQASSPAREAPHNAQSKIDFLIADGAELPFADGMFDLVTCNSVLHHLANPSRVLSEIARVTKRPTGAILVRDLRRPPPLLIPLHVRWYGRHYSGLMYKLYGDSVRAAYTPRELSHMLQSAPLRGARIFVEGRTHLGFERPAT